MKRKRPSYLRTVVASLTAMLKGMKLSGKHYVKGYRRAAPMGIANPDYFKKDQGPITIQYPMEKVPIPDTGRYRLFMETDDCIGCDKCARICPVDCITIETFRADGDLGRTSDGTMKRLHLPVFDIDMGKCMYCGLCTTVCPTECLVMTPVYDFSEYDRDNFIYHFGAYSPEEESRIRTETEAALAAKKAAKTTLPSEPTDAPQKRRPMVQRSPVQEPQVETSSSEPEAPPKAKPRPMMRPIMKKAGDESQDTPQQEEKKPEEVVPEEKPSSENANEEKPEQNLQKPRPRPLMKRPENTEGGPEV